MDGALFAARVAWDSRETQRKKKVAIKHSFFEQMEDYEAVGECQEESKAQSYDGFYRKNERSHHT